MLRSLRHDDLDVVHDGTDVSHVLQDMKDISAFMRESNRSVYRDGPVPDDELESDDVNPAAKERTIDVSGEAAIARGCAALLASLFGRLAGQHSAV